MDAEALFDELYKKAEARMHVLLRQVGRIRADKLNTFSWPTGVRIVNGMQPLFAEFDAKLTKTAYDVRLRVRRGRHQCPFCHNPDCPDAVFVPEGYQLFGPKETAAYIAGFFNP